MRWQRRQNFSLQKQYWALINGKIRGAEDKGIVHRLHLEFTGASQRGFIWGFLVFCWRQIWIYWYDSPSLGTTTPMCFTHYWHHCCLHLLLLLKLHLQPFFKLWVNKEDLSQQIWATEVHHLHAASSAVSWPPVCSQWQQTKTDQLFHIRLTFTCVNSPSRQCD